MPNLIIELPITDALKRCGVTRFVKERSSTLVLMCNNSSNNAKKIIIIFHIQESGLFATIEDFAKASKGKIKQETQEAIKFCLTQGEYPQLFLKNNSSISDTDHHSSTLDEVNRQAAHVTSGGGNDDVINNSGCVIDAFRELDTYVPDKDYSECIIKTIQKTVKQEDVLIRQILYTALSSASDNPINLGIIAPTSEGKTWPVMRTLNYFTQEKVWNVGQMSKALVRQKGVLIDNKGHFIGQRVKELRKQMACLGNNKTDKEEKAELKQQLNELLENSKTLIELSGMILLFFEPPDTELWNLLKPILSHDKLEIEFPYVEKTQNEGYLTKKVVVRGWPAYIFCSAKDESNWAGWPEILSRFIITSPNMNKTKYLESNMLIAQTQSLPRFIQEKIIVSTKDEEIAKLSISYLLDKIANFFKRVNNQHGSGSKENEEEEASPVWIPFGNILGEVLKSEKGTDNRTVKRLFAFIKIISLAKAELRQKLIYNQKEEYVVASLEDLAEALYITQNMSGIPAYKLKFYKQVFLPLHTSKQYKDKSPDEKKEETIIGVTSKQLSDYNKQQTGKEINPENLRKNFLDELENHDYVGSVKSVIDGRQKVYYPLIDLENNNNDDFNENDEKIKKLWNSSKFHNFLQNSSIVLPKNCRDIPENWLIFEILGLAKYGIDLDNFKGCIADFLNQSEELKFLGKDGNRLTIKQFISEYEKDTSLIPYFRRAKINTIYNKTFGYMLYLGENWQEEYKKLQNQVIFRNFRNFELDYKKQRQGISEENRDQVNISYDIDALLAKQREKDREGIYKLNNSSDRWHCEHCNLNGDKWFMRAHACST